MTSLSVNKWYITLKKRDQARGNRTLQVSVTRSAPTPLLPPYYPTPPYPFLRVFSLHCLCLIFYTWAFFAGSVLRGTQREYSSKPLKGRYTRGVLLPEHAPGARSGSKAPPCVPTISLVYFILGSRIVTIFNRLNTWEQAPGANNAPSCVLTRAKWSWSMLREQNPSCVSALKVALLNVF